MLKTSSGFPSKILTTELIEHCRVAMRVNSSSSADGVLCRWQEQRAPSGGADSTQVSAYPTLSPVAHPPHAKGGHSAAASRSSHIPYTCHITTVCSWATAVRTLIQVNKTEKSQMDTAAGTPGPVGSKGGLSRVHSLEDRGKAIPQKVI